MEMSDVSTTLLGGLVGHLPAALDLPHALVEWVSLLVVTREGDRRCKLRPSQRAMVALVYLREHTTVHSLQARGAVRSIASRRPASRSCRHARGGRPRARPDARHR